MKALATQFLIKGRKEMKELYTVKEATDLLKVTRRTLYTYINEGKLEAFKIGKEWRIPKEALERFIGIVK